MARISMGTFALYSRFIISYAPGMTFLFQPTAQQQQARQQGPGSYRFVLQT
jgi:hypothetical protein